MKNSAITPIKTKICLSKMQAFWMLGQSVKAAPVNLIQYCVNDTRIEIKFKPQHIFGVQHIKVTDLNKLLVFGHKNREYRICICNKETPEDEIKKILL